MRFSEKLAFLIGRYAHCLDPADFRNSDVELLWALYWCETKEIKVFCILLFTRLGLKFAFYWCETKKMKVFQFDPPSSEIP